MSYDVLAHGEGDRCAPTDVTPGQELLLRCEGREADVLKERPHCAPQPDEPIDARKRYLAHDGGQIERQRGNEDHDL